jgi:glycerol-3-phosphate dehydrogenase
MRQFSAETRAANLTRMAETRFDVLVIGGGITGTGIALDAASRGLSVALVEKDDFASGTSGRSSRMIHGGLRYLAQHDLGLVREALRERKILRQLAPHIIRPLPALIPAGSPREAAKYRLGLTAYEALGAGRNIGSHRPVSREQILTVAPGFSGAGGGYRYFECQGDDARLTIEVARAAQGFGALLANHVRAERLLGAGRVTGAGVTDEVTGEQFEIQAAVTVNAGGVWADQIQAMAAGSAATADTGGATAAARDRRLIPSKGVHLVFAPGAVRTKVALFVPSAAGDGHFIFVVPWEDRVYAGTTDTPYSGDLNKPAVGDADRDYILATVARDFPGVTERDIVASWAGLRPLLSHGQGDVRTYDLSRKHAIFEDPPGLLTITGGKLTTYRAMAEDLVDHLASTLRPAGRCQTRHIPLGLHGSAEAAFRLAAAEASSLGLVPDTGTRLVRCYGDDWREAIRMIGADRSLGEPAVDDLPVLKVELELARSREMAITGEDVFVRRTRLTTRDASVPLPLAADRSNLQPQRPGNDLERRRGGPE